MAVSAAHIREELAAVGVATGECEVCHQGRYSVVTGAIPLLPFIDGTGRFDGLDPTKIPVALRSCEACGHITMHSLIALGLAESGDYQLNRHR
jgi:hypothetical protein